MRPVLEAAVAVARDGLRADPAVVPPTILRPYLGFRRLTGPALDAALKALEADEAFRARVRVAFAASAPGSGAVDVDVDPSAVAASMVLDQAEGWRRDVQAMASVLEAEAEEADAVVRARRLDRDLERLRAERDAAVSTARVAGDRLAATERELAEVRDVVAGLRRELDDASRQLSASVDDRQRAVRDLKATEARLATRREELGRTEADNQRLRDELDHALVQVRRLEEAVDAPGAVETAPLLSPSPPEPAERPADELAGAGSERARILAALQQVTDAAATLTSALGSVAAVVAGEPTRGVAAASDGPTPAAETISSVRGPDPGSGRRGPRRVPRLPVGMFDDSVDAAEHLVRLPGAVVLVDGYNVSLEGWPSRPLHEQRDRLVDALADLAARSGCQVLVVFDGSDAGRGLPGESRPRGVQVRFTPPRVEADDELLALVEEVPVDRPVVVVSSDRRVANGSTRLGAASVSAAQLLALLAR